MIGFPIEVLLLCMFGVATCIAKNSRNKRMKKVGNFSFLLIIFSYPLAVLLDPLLPLPNTPTNLLQSFVCNSLVVLGFLVGYFITKKAFSGVIEE